MTEYIRSGTRSKARSYPAAFATDSQVRSLDNVGPWELAARARLAMCSMHSRGPELAA